MYHTCVRTLDELGQAAGGSSRCTGSSWSTKRADSNSYKMRQGRLHIRKIQKMQWTERAGKRERNRVEFRLDVVVLEPHLLEGVPLPWMLTMDDLETWLSLQARAARVSRASAAQARVPNSGGDVRAHLAHDGPLMRLCQAADMINEHHRGPSAYLSCVPRYSLAAGMWRPARRARHKEYARPATRR